MKILHKVQTEAEFVREHRRGDVRSDGKIFESYRYVRGKVYERWCSAEQLIKRRASSTKHAYAWACRPENRPKIRAWSKASMKLLRKKKPEQFILTAARHRAKKKGIPFNLICDDIVIPECCPVLGVQLVLGEGICSDNSPSLDRIIPELGYVRGNVKIISRRANRIKNDATPDELYKVWKYATEQF